NRSHIQIGHGKLVEVLHVLRIDRQGFFIELTRHGIVAVLKRSPTSSSGKDCGHLIAQLCAFRQRSTLCLLPFGQGCKASLGKLQKLLANRLSVDGRSLCCTISCQEDDNGQWA